MIPEDNLFKIKCFSKNILQIRLECVSSHTSKPGAGKALISRRQASEAIDQHSSFTISMLATFLSNVRPFYLLLYINGFYYELEYFILIE